MVKITLEYTDWSYHLCVLSSQIFGLYYFGSYLSVESLWSKQWRPEPYSTPYKHILEYYFTA